MNIKDKLKELRPNLSQGSLTTYTSILKNLHKNVFGNKEIEKSDYDEYERILEYLKDVAPNKRKTTLAALVVLTDNDHYRTKMNSDVSECNAQTEKQEMTETQRENWVDGNTIRETFDVLERDAKILYKKTHKTNADMQQIQNYIIVALYSLIPPRRAVDYCEMKIRNANHEEDNYIDKNKFVFNKYKTAKTYGRQELDIPQQLKSILNRWIAINPSDHLLIDNNFNNLNSVKLNQRIERIFGKKVGVNGFRHTYLTDKYKTTSEEYKRLAKDMTDMGSSSNMSDTYIKLK